MKNIQSDDIAGTYLVKTQSKELNLIESTDELKEHEIKEIDFSDEDNHLFESSSEAPSNHSHQQLIRFEYHVLYHISYAVPYLCFNAYKSSMFYSKIVSDF